MGILFTVVAGKLSEEGENFKYINDFESMGEAIQAIKDDHLMSYPFCRIEMYKNGTLIHTLEEGIL